MRETNPWAPGYTAPDSSTNTYTYDTLNRLSTLTNSWAGSFGFSYDGLNRRTQLTRPNNVTTNYSYDKMSHLLSVLHQLAGSTIDGATYTLDNAGNRTAKTDDLANVTTDYNYDPIYELLSATQGVTTESYTYDAVGNRLSSLGLSPYSFNTSNELTSTPNASYTYDNNGNTTSKTDSSGTTNYAWDHENRLSGVTLPNSGGTVQFKYDPFGRRIEKISPTATTIFAYDGDNLVETVNASGGEVASYTRGQNIDEPLAMDQAGTVDYYEQDGLGSVTSLTSATGTVTQSYTYDSFGNTTNSSGSLTNFFRYTGREFDTETGLYYYRARYYDPSTGRFLIEDPIGFDAGPNFYEYVRNNPNRFRDPYGQDIWIEGPSGAEPRGHMSINVGNPNGQYSSYSFGLDRDLPGFFPGEVYQDTSLGGAFVPGYYLQTTPDQDAIAKAYLDGLLGETAPYRPWSTCRNFSITQFEHFRKIGLGIPAAPPSRPVDPRDEGGYMPGPIGTTATDPQNEQNWIQKLLQMWAPPIPF